MRRPTAFDPVNTTPPMRASATSRAPTRAPSPGSSCSTAREMPACSNSCTASAAVALLCSAGLASTALPAASAAATWPVKIANGKFHGLMQATTPSGKCEV